MKILFFGDVFGRPGREALKKQLPKLVNKHKPDFVIANVENMAHGRGVTRNTFNEMQEIGLIDVYTSGDHIWDTPGGKELIEDPTAPLLRPANLNGNHPGKGYMVVQKGSKRILVVNLIGEVFMNKLETLNPFHSADDVLSKYTMNPSEEGREHVDAIFVDFHAEATSEKRVLAFYLDGRISAFVGTHTHVPTRDEQVLPKGTAYITDVGMVGPYNSSIGLDMQGLIDEYLAGEKKKREVGSDPYVELGAVLIELRKNGTAKDIRHLRELVKIQ